LQSPAPNGPERLDLFSTLTALVQQTGATIALGDLHDDAAWNAATATLILRADADTEIHACALAEFIRHTTLGADFSRFIDTADRHLRVV
jgi:hypothetical protein